MNAPSRRAAPRGGVLDRHAVTVHGSGPPMLFAHGFGCDQTMWRHVAPAFAADHTTVTFDYLGMGRADARAYDPRRYSTLGGYAEAVLEICEALDLRDVTLVGHSVSATIAVLAAQRDPARFRRLVLVAPSPCFVNHPPDYYGGFEPADIDGLLGLMDQNFVGWAGQFAPVIARNADRAELAGELRTSFCAADPTIARAFAELTFRADNRADLGGVRVPSLILQCEDDSVAPVEVGRYMARHLPGSTLHVLHAEGHCPHLSHPDETIAAIRAFIANG
jgi:sigma-B regulation protein RsbQ